ncbi:hypothetical protein CI610_03544 [invertebrate metagenome]|uniref:Uncharacterized protein n=1 Tax=invertebrate metagenome TaxID=1711999 RepID=A0A2H9T2V6_9ZZZZ
MTTEMVLSMAFEIQLTLDLLRYVGHELGAIESVSVLSDPVF